MTTQSVMSRFPVVCVGGSSADIHAYTGLLERLPADLGVAIVIVNYQSMVADQLLKVLPQFTQMPIELIQDGTLVRPNRIFILKEERDLHVLDGAFHLTLPSKPTGWPDVVTVFLRSFAENWDGKLIAIILSGYDGDGAAALCEIKNAGGITMAQKVDTAGQPDMPLSAIASGHVDFILPVEQIAIEVQQAARKWHAIQGKDSAV